MDKDLLTTGTEKQLNATVEQNINNKFDKVSTAIIPIVSGTVPVVDKNLKSSNITNEEASNIVHELQSQCHTSIQQIKQGMNTICTNVADNKNNYISKILALEKNNMQLKNKIQLLYLCLIIVTLLESFAVLCLWIK